MQIAQVNGVGIAAAGNAERRQRALLEPSSHSHSQQQEEQQQVVRAVARSNGSTARERAEYKLTVLCVGMIMLFLMGVPLLLPLTLLLCSVSLLAGPTPAHRYRRCTVYKYR